MHGGFSPVHRHSFLYFPSDLLNMLLLIALLAVATDFGRSQETVLDLGSCYGRSYLKYLVPNLALYARCTPSYVECIHDEPIIRKCYNNLSFNPDIRDCVPRVSNPLCRVNPCRQLVNGDYPHPNGECGSYMRCIDGWTIIIECDKKGEVWNRASKRCEPFAVVPPPCGPPTIPPTIITSTPEEPTTPASFCVGRLSGDYLPLGYRCSELYYQCRNYGFSRIICPNKLSFNPLSGVCIRVRDNALCRENPCYRLDDGLYPHPSGECGRYMRCDSGWAVFVECEEAGLVWNQAAKQCTVPSLAPLPCGVPPTTTTVANPPTTTPFDCPSRDGNYAPVNLPCPGFYWQCHPSGVRRIECPNGLSFDHTKNSCVRIENNPFCSKNPCEGIIDGLYPDPKGKCDSYMHCVNGWGVFVQCEKEEHVWNDDIKQCSPRSLVAPPCGSFVTTPATDPPTRPTTLPPFSCEGKSVGNHREPGTLCLSSFYQCHRDSLPKRILCPGTNRYDHQDDQCIRFADCLKKFGLA